MRTALRPSDLRGRLHPDPVPPGSRSSWRSQGNSGRLGSTCVSRGGVAGGASKACARPFRRPRPAWTSRPRTLLAHRGPWVPMSPDRNCARASPVAINQTAIAANVVERIGAVTFMTRRPPREWGVFGARARLIAVVAFGSASIYSTRPIPRAREVAVALQLIRTDPEPPRVNPSTMYCPPIRFEALLPTRLRSAWAA